MRTFSIYLLFVNMYSMVGNSVDSKIGAFYLQGDQLQRTMASLGEGDLNFCTEDDNPETEKFERRLNDLEIQIRRLRKMMAIHGRKIEKLTNEKVQPNTNAKKFGSDEEIAELDKLPRIDERLEKIRDIGPIRDEVIFYFAKITTRKGERIIHGEGAHVKAILLYENVIRELLPKLTPGLRAKMEYALQNSQEANDRDFKKEARAIRKAMDEIYAYYDPSLRLTLPKDASNKKILFFLQESLYYRSQFNRLYNGKTTYKHHENTLIAVRPHLSASFQRRIDELLKRKEHNSVEYISRLMGQCISDIAYFYEKEPWRIEQWKKEDREKRAGKTGG